LPSALEVGPLVQPKACIASSSGSGAARSAAEEADGDSVGGKAAWGPYPGG
jgi:hypothetical protein